MMKWGENIQQFIKIANKHEVKMIMIGGGAVNFHGYQRHSADVDFWIDTSEGNLLRWKVLSFDDLMYSKTKSSRPKDLLDIQQLKLKK